MKRVFSFILITAVTLPLFGCVFAASPSISASTDKSTVVQAAAPVVPDQKSLIAGLKDIYTRLNTLSSQTQLAMNQLNANGVTTTQAELDLVNANAALAKAKTAIDKLSPQTPPDSFKVSVTSVEVFLKDGRNNILATLTDLKNALPALSASNQ